MQLTTYAQRRTKLTRKLVKFRLQIHGARQEIHGGRRVGALPRANARASESLSAGLCKLSRTLIHARELSEIPKRLLEVIADEFVCAAPAVEAPRGALVQVCALRLRDTAIRDVAHEDVVEVEYVLGRVDESSLRKVGQVTICPLWFLGRRHVVELLAREAAPHDRCTTEHRQLAWVEAVEPACDQRFDRRWRRQCEIRRLPGQREELLGKEGIASGMLDDLRFQLWVERRVGEAYQQHGDLLRGERLEHDQKARRSGAAPGRPGLSELAARSAEDEDGGLGPLAEVLDQVEECRLRPVDVVEDEDDRPVSGDRLDEAADSPEGLARCCRSFGQSDQLGDPLRDLLGVVLLGKQLGDSRRRRFGRDLPDDLGQREVRGTLAVRDTATDEHAPFVADSGQELPHESRLADARLADDSDDAAMPVVARTLVGTQQALELLLATNQRRVEPARVRRRAGHERLQTPRAVDLLGADRVAHELESLRADQHFSRWSVLFELRGPAHGGTGDVQVLAGSGQDVDLARGHADACLELNVPCSCVEIPECVSHLDGGADSAERIVLVQLGNAEDRHHRIADELLDGPAVALDRLADDLEVARDQAAIDLGIKP